jgi:hypothetical protein
MQMMQALPRPSLPPASQRLQEVPPFRSRPQVRGATQDYHLMAMHRHTISRMKEKTHGCLGMSATMML